MPEVTIPNNFTPRPYQRRAMAYFDKGGKRAITVWHRRGGKDLTAMHQTCKMMHQRKAAYWHIFPTAEQGRKAIWEGFTKTGERIMEQVFPAAIRKSPRAFTTNGEMVVELKCGSIWRLLGSDKMEVVGAGPAGVVFSEFALAKPNTWDLVRPMLRENEGWAWFITTPRGKNHAHKLFKMAEKDPAWFADLKSLFDTRAYDPEATIAEERAEGMPEELISQEYCCDWTAALVGSFYGVLLGSLEKRGWLQAFELEEDERDNVFTSWDIGKADDTAIWWWRPNSLGGIDILDHYASHNEELDHYFAIIESRAEEYGWRYRKHWLPHDAKAKTLATKVSVLDQCWARFGRDMVAIGPKLLLRDGIAAVRRLLQGETRKVKEGERKPGPTRIHPRCSNVAGPKDCDGVEALRMYRREWDDEAKCFGDLPVHDWASHTADGMRYLALESEHVLGITRKPAKPEKLKVVKPTPISLDDLYREHDLSRTPWERM